MNTQDPPCVTSSRKPSLTLLQTESGAASEQPQHLCGGLIMTVYSLLIANLCIFLPHLFWVSFIPVSPEVPWFDSMIGFACSLVEWPQDSTSGYCCV